MPPVTIGNTGKYVSKSPNFSVNFDYEYPDGLNLKPGSKLHDRIRDEVMERAYESSRVMSTRHGDWNKIDHTLTAYIPVDEEERLLKDGDSRKPISIVFPYSYTVLETLLSYFVAAFLQDPIFKYEGTTPDDVNFLLPFTDIAYMGEMTPSVLTFRQLLPMLRMDLAILAPAYRWMILLYGTPILFADKKWLRFVNIGRLS